jgi:hypothetical protein
MILNVTEAKEFGQADRRVGALTIPGNLFGGRLI